MLVLLLRHILPLTHHRHVLHLLQPHPLRLAQPPIQDGVRKVRGTKISFFVTCKSCWTGLLPVCLQSSPTQEGRKFLYLSKEKAYLFKGKRMREAIWR